MLKLKFYDLYFKRIPFCACLNLLMKTNGEQKTIFQNKIRLNLLTPIANSP